MRWLETVGDQSTFSLEEKIALLDLMIDNYIGNTSERDMKDLKEAREHLIAEKILLSDE